VNAAGQRPGSAQWLRPTVQDRPLAAMLDETCQLAEALLPGARCSLQLHDAAGITLQPGAGANLPACWSVPLRAGGRVVGALAAHYDTPHAPTGEELRRVESCARLAELVLEQHATQQAQADAEAGFRTAAELLPGHLFIIQPDGQRLYANAHYEATTGVPIDLLQGDGWRAVLHPDDAEETLAAYFAALRGRLPWEWRFRIRTGDGTYRWYMSRLRPQTRDDGSVAVWIGVEIDIDDLVTAQQMLDRYRAELEEKVAARTRALEATAAELEAEMARREAAMAALAHSQKVEALGQLTGGVAHDFNNLLSAIMGGLELIDRRTDDPAVGKLARQGLQTCERAAALVRQLLAVARRDPPEPRRVEPARALPQLRNLLRHAVHVGIELTIEVAADTWSVLVDPPQLETALLNLALNARDAMPTGGRLAVTAENCAVGAARPATLPPRDYVRISVTDTGCGIPPHVLPHVLEPFFTTKPRSEGTGLGLAMVQAFVRNAGGEIGVHSEPGQGTVISLFLPRAADVPAEAPPADPPVPQPADHATILVVDDNDAVRFIAGAFLRDAGYDVVEASGGQPALAVMRSRPADLVVTDLAMPGMDGTQLAAQVRAEWPGVPVIFVTGYGDKFDLSRERTVQKPYAAKTLLGAVAEALQARRK
jgi:PAS domain S-box-containing protein